MNVSFRIRCVFMTFSLILSVLILCGCNQDNSNQTITAAASVKNNNDSVTPALTLNAKTNNVVEGKCFVGEYICLSTDNPNPETKYNLMTKNGEKEWKIEKRNVSSGIIIKAPEEPCFFRARLAPVKSEKSSPGVRSYLISVCMKTNEKLEDNGSRLSTKHVCYGDNSITAIPSFKGGTPPYQYSYHLITASNIQTELLGYTESSLSKIDFSTSLGRYEIGITAKDGDGNTAQIKLPLISNDILPMKNIYQYSDPPLPTGCEATALTSCLNYFGYQVTKNEIADKYIKKVKFTEKNGQLIGGDPAVEFAGDPNSENAYGCYSQCIADAANKYFESIGSDSYAETIDLKTPDEMYEYLASGQPVLIWSTMFLWETYPTDSWKTKDGKEIKWLCNEHCYVMTGMNTQKTKVGVADPMTDTDSITFYDAEEFLHHYRELGSHAVVINVR